MWRNLILSALVVCVLTAGASITNAELLITVNVLNPVDSSLTIEGTDQILLAVKGNTPTEPNNVSVTASGGTLQPVADVNQQYLLDFNDESMLAIVSLIANTDIIIKEKPVPEGTPICELYFFFDGDNNIVSIIGLGLNELIPPEEEEIEQSEFLAEEPVEQSDVSIEESTSEVEPQPTTYYNLLPPIAIRQEKQKVLMNCPNSIGAIAHIRPNKEEIESLTMTDEGGGQSLLDGTIEVSTDITTNQIWTSNNTYYITETISVQALLVIEPGTTVKYVTDRSMLVNNGGTLISAGTPDNPIVYTSDSADPWYGNYYCAIFIDETASASTKITYSFIEYAYYGIWVMNNRLDSPIENNYLYHNAFGILEYGVEHTDVYNNLIYASYYNGIEINMESYEGQASADSHILIQNNTCDYYQDVGIAVFGVDNETDAGEVELTNNIVSGSYECGVVLANGYMYPTVSNTGYYDNVADRFGYNESDEYNPVYETTMPYVDGTGTLPVCYLNPNSTFVNTSDEYIEQTRLIGKTSDINGFPDSSKADLGFHYPNWNFSNPGSGDSLSADLDDSLIVDFNDFAALADYWQQSTLADADLDDSGFVDYGDLAILADQWIKLADPNIIINIYGDSNNGYIEVGINGFTSDILRTFMLLNGQYVDEILFFKDNQKLYLDISALSDGPHQIKAISIDNNNKVVCSNLTEASFNCSFNYCTSVAYEQSEPYYFQAFYQGSDNINVKVYDEDENLAWSQAYPPQNINGFIPSEVTSRNDLNNIVFEPQSGGGITINKPLALKFNPKKVPANIRALYISPDFWIHEFANGNVEKEVKRAFETRGVPYYQLELWSATYKNLAWFAANRNIQYIYFAGHGFYNLGEGSGETLRTGIILRDGYAVSAKYTDFLPGQRPSWCEPLPITYEMGANSFFRLGFSPEQLRFVHFDCCFSGRLRLTSENQLVESPEGYEGMLAGPELDMSWAFGMTGGGIYGQFYQSWWGDIQKGFTTPFNTFAVREWQKLREGEFFDSALLYAINSPGVEAARENLRVYGMGFFWQLE